MIPKRNGDRFGESQPKRSGPDSSTERWRPSRREPGEDDKFRDFRAEKPGFQRYNAAEARHNRGNMQRNNRQYNNHDEDEAVPEWMTDGADTMYDTIDLDNCKLPEHQGLEKKEIRNDGSGSPELVPFDFGSGGLEGDAPKGLVGFDSKELDDLIGQIPDDLGQVSSDDEGGFGDVGTSRFSSFFNKSGSNTAQDRKPPSPRLHNIDPSVWGPPPPQLSQQIQHIPPPETRPPIIDPLRTLTGIISLL